MKKIGSLLLKIAVAVVLFLGFVLAKVGVKSCNDYISNKSAASEMVSYCEKLAKQLNAQCPSHPDSWTTIQSVVMSGHQLMIKYVVDDDVIDSFSLDSYKMQQLRAFKKIMSKMEMIKFGRELKNAEIIIQLLVYRASGELEHQIEISGNDFINPPIDYGEIFNNAN